VDIAIARLTGVDVSALKLVEFGSFVYAALFAIEGIGLVARRTWAEWLTVGSTSLLLPFEIHHLLRHPTPGRAGIIAVNVAIVVYLFRQAQRARTG